MPFCKTQTKRQAFQEIVSKMSARLSGWKKRTLQQVGRNVLIQSVALSIPLYVMQTYLLPQSICNELDKCAPKHAGGLGFRQFTDYNLAFSTKITWQLCKEEHKPWVKLIRAEYLRGKSLWGLKEWQSGCSWIWRSIWESKDILFDGICYRVSSNSNLRIKKDPWLLGFSQPRPPENLEFPTMWIDQVIELEEVICCICGQEVETYDMNISFYDALYLKGYGGTQCGKRNYKRLPFGTKNIWNPPPLGWIKLNFDAAFVDKKAIVAVPYPYAYGSHHYLQLSDRRRCESSSNGFQFYRQDQRKQFTSEIPEFQRNKVWHVDYNIWDNRARGHLARSLIDPPQPNKEEILLMNKKPCPSLKPFHQLDFIGNETDCKEDDEVTTAIEIDTMKEKMPAAPSCSKKFSRKTSVQLSRPTVDGRPRPTMDSRLNFQTTLWPESYRGQ
ncbi:hypothetical protein M9H77_12760 [Catharanthus roseus]|uniref:Uncharacterized protein n=1 Tax=Catharanthus roseus TaxID=4058 RepID=A0ACC0BIC1_CATRO|nr:hypothetical protein M9H77_12760 [Catharanthus roseus]